MDTELLVMEASARLLTAIGSFCLNVQALLAILCSSWWCRAAPRAAEGVRPRLASTRLSWCPRMPHLLRFLLLCLALRGCQANFSNGSGICESCLQCLIYAKS